MITIRVCSKFYSQKAVQDCIYWFSDRVAVNARVADGEFLIECRTDERDFEARFLQKLNDFNLRESIAERTSEIKNLIIAKAFYPDSLNIAPVGKFEDPVMMEKNNESE